jgi:hypothetical protein
VESRQTRGGGERPTKAAWWHVGSEDLAAQQRSPATSDGRWSAVPQTRGEHEKRTNWEKRWSEDRSHQKGDSVAAVIPTRGGKFQRSGWVKWRWWRTKGLPARL